MSSVFGVLCVLFPTVSVNVVTVTVGVFCVVVFFFSVFGVFGVLVLGVLVLGVPPPPLPPRFFTLLYRRRRPIFADIFFIFGFISIVCYYLFYYL
jgi:hypothetical protein